MNLPRAIFVLLAIAGTAAAQPPHQEPRETDPVAMKARLERWLEETRHREQVIQAGLKRLNEGGSTDDVRKIMDPGMRLPRTGGREAGGREPGAREPQGRPGDAGRSRRDAQPSDARPHQPFDREQVLAFIDAQNPEMAARMRGLARENPEAADRILSRIWPQIQEVMAERDEQTREIRVAQLKNGWEVIDAVRDIRESGKSGDDAARARSVERLRELLGQGFDLRVRLHVREVAVLEDRLARLKQELINEHNARDTFIADRIKQATEMRDRREPRPDGKPDGKPDARPDSKPRP